MRKKAVLDHFGGPSATARALGIKHQAVSQWGKLVPWRTAYRVEALTDGVLKVDPRQYQ
jgi:DNA-binding transcriptional regulator YdaS (Cro superfamily)